MLRRKRSSLLHGQNDLFPVHHAEKVLAGFGRAFGVLPELPGNASKARRRFLKQAVSGLAQDAEKRMSLSRPAFLSDQEELADKCNEGQLTPDERAEHGAYISTSNFIVILQAKARSLLARHKAS